MIGLTSHMIDREMMATKWDKSIVQLTQQPDRQTIFL